MTHNRQQSQLDQDEQVYDARKEQIRLALQSTPYPMFVAGIVRVTGLDASEIRPILLDMVAEGEVTERSRMYSL